jgi:PASTA domain
VLGRPVQVEVPDVRGMFTVQARHVLARAGLRIKVAQPAGQAALTGSIVIDQSPVPGASIRRRGLSPAELGDLPADRGDRGVQVGVGLAQPARLAAAQTAEGDQVIQRVQPVAPRMPEELGGLTRGPHHNRRRPRRRDVHRDRVHPLAAGAGVGEPGLEVVLPGAGALGGPHQRPGPAAGRQVDQGGRVDVEHAGMLLDVRGDRRPERGPDPLLGRGPR